MVLKSLLMYFSPEGSFHLSSSHADLPGAPLRRRLRATTNNQPLGGEIKNKKKQSKKQAITVKMMVMMMMMMMMVVMMSGDTVCGQQ